jgi:hypothetical protein
LWPSMGIIVAYDRAGYPHGVWYPAMELATGGFLSVIDLDKVSVDRDPVTNNMTVRCIWENAPRLR